MPNAMHSATHKHVRNTVSLFIVSFMLYILHIINRPLPGLTAVLHPQGYTAISFAVLVLATQGTAIAPLLFIALSLDNLQGLNQLAHALPPLASALDTYAFSPLRNVDNRRDYDKIYLQLLRRDIVCGALCHAILSHLHSNLPTLYDHIVRIYSLYRLDYPHRIALT